MMELLPLITTLVGGLYGLVLVQTLAIWIKLTRLEGWGKDHDRRIVKTEERVESLESKERLAFGREQAEHHTKSKAQGSS